MNLDDALTLLARDPAAPLDLAEVALLLARDEYPGLDVEAYLGELAGMAREARAYVRGDLAARAAGLCRYLFHEMGFHGNTRHYYDPRNSYLNDVLDRRTGIPISLSVVAVAVGRRAGLTVEGVGLPGHFIAKAVGPGGEQVLFDPFHFGRLLTPRDCERLVREVTGLSVCVTADVLDATPAGRVAQRILANLKAIYYREGDFPRAARVLERLRRLDPADPGQRRDLGVCLARAGRPGQALDHLAAYLDAAPDAPDAGPVRCLLHEARAEVSRWN
jgi:regulator of sirC expression with transglutaminase-like and TPR domain